MPLIVFQGEGALVAARRAAPANSVLIEVGAAIRSLDMIEQLAAGRDVILALPDGWSYGGRRGSDIILKKPDGSVTMPCATEPQVIGQEPVSSRLRQLVMLGAAP